MEVDAIPVLAENSHAGKNQPYQVAGSPLVWSHPSPGLILPQAWRYQGPGDSDPVRGSTSSSVCRWISLSHSLAFLIYPQRVLGWVTTQAHGALTQVLEFSASMGYDAKPVALPAGRQHCWLER